MCTTASSKSGAVVDVLEAETILLKEVTQGFSDNSSSQEVIEEEKQFQSLEFEMNFTASQLFTPEDGEAKLSRPRVWRIAY